MACVCGEDCGNDCLDCGICLFEFEECGCLSGMCQDCCEECSEEE